MTVSRELQSWLITELGMAPDKVWHICDGVDTHQFRPLPAARTDRGNIVVVGSVTRFEPDKDPLNLVRAFLEAMATGLPIVATATGGNAELIVAGVNGRLVPPGDIKALAEAIVAYAEDAQMRREHGRASRTRAESAYSLARMLKDYWLLYRSAVRRV